ncbi:MAG: LVIVD repeat-containing protein [Cyclobacteriaceae bacterium]
MKALKHIYILFLAIWILGCSDGDGLRLASPTGTGGSMARFAIASNHLFVVRNQTMQVYEILAEGGLEFSNEVPIGFGIETIFARGNNLFIGAEDAIYIYDISEPEVPRRLSRYSHIIACDPVVVQGNYAYATLRISGCRTFGSDVLEVIDISNLSSPRLVTSINMSSPFGLGIDGTLLFVCEGNLGLKVFDATDPENPVHSKTYSAMHAWDVIPNQGTLIMTGQDGIAQYDYSDPEDIQLLSEIKIGL